MTLLDPAGPMFYPEIFTKHVTADDADFVDAIHTDAGIYGAPVSTGTVDFWPNGGFNLQPGCPHPRMLFQMNDNDFCSHWRSWDFYAETVLKNDAMPAVKCRSYIAYKLGFCRKNPRIYMGYAVPTNSSGNYYLKTGSVSPFGIRTHSTH